MYLVTELGASGDQSNSNSFMQYLPSMSFSHLNSHLQDPVLALSRLVLSKSDPIQTLASRSALIADPQVFNLTLKGIDGKGTYPGPRVNQASSGRCWLFATSEILHSLDYVNWS